MAKARVLIVEDEHIVAEDLRDMLQHMEYEVVDMASSGAEAILKSKQLSPDLILMDIRLNGRVDGIQAAEAIATHQGIPVIYLTAYADEKTLERAKATMPFGYILKPFEERNIRTAIEIALYKSSMEQTITKMNNWYASALGSLTEAVVATNTLGNITFMNPAAEALIGWSMRDIFGKRLYDIFSASQTHASRKVTGTLTTKNGQRLQVECSTAPIKSEEGQAAGDVIIIHSLAVHANGLHPVHHG